MTNPEIPPADRGAPTPPVAPTGKTGQPKAPAGSAYNVGISVALMEFFNALGANYQTSLNAMQTFNDLLNNYSQRELKISNEIAKYAKKKHNTAIVAQLKGEQQQVQNLISSTQATETALTQMQATVASQMSNIGQFFETVGASLTQNM